ncbi:MAG: tRNA pseudouridine(38-40) synthase TruA [Natronospirillum sp.]|uniref:tRNA pseudouridine(38-40) synthase TruA n=1 Tax=Natronospirillum sp. TaxID=2812955 RepID=UPI0025DD82B5|nr:tRNA pseudouridine(38-40) synthase TruA [Natronospirillum sp.]MCH8551370.1 tRNA pseudouridine(38-40) synthase TruA [Natronospirillum sp.]
MSVSTLKNDTPEADQSPDQAVQEVFAPDRPDYRHRWAAGVEYQGTAYHGYQMQRGTAQTIQQHLQAAIGAVADHPVRLFCAGRTDARVHATSQVIHFDTQSERKPVGWVLGANTRLPDDISLQWVKAVPHTFHARFVARARRYRYLVYNHPVPSAVMRYATTWEKRPLDERRMQRAADYFTGTHDFSSFRAAECQAKSPVRTVHHCTVARRGKLIVLDIRADAFLHHMVRNIAGVLMAIGAGEAPVQWAAQVLASRSRSQGGVTARPDGLYLVGAEYDDAFQLPAPALGPAFLAQEILQPEGVS